jgi:predicted DNA-binding ribbon-helix-helix protein
MAGAPGDTSGIRGPLQPGCVDLGGSLSIVPFADPMGSLLVSDSKNPVEHVTRIVGLPSNGDPHIHQSVTSGCDPGCFWGSREMVRHRIVQHRGRRYSIKLEEAVWHTLDVIADGLGVRLNQLIGQVAGGLSDNSSLTAALRLFCLEQSLERIAVLERDLNNRSLVSSGVPLASIIEACPSPCLLVRAPDEILRINEPGRAWFGTDGEALVGKSLSHYLQIRCKPKLAEVLDAYANGDTTTYPARVVYLRPGRLVMAKASLCPALVSTDGLPVYLLMIDTAPQRQ